MYATIYDAVKDLFGVEIIHLKLLQSFGFFVAISFLLCAWTFAKELERKSNEGLLPMSKRKAVVGVAATQGELIGQFIIGFLLGWKLVGSFVDYTKFSDDKFGGPRGWILSGQGSILWGIIVGGAFVGFLYWRSNKKKEEKPREIEIKVTAADQVGTMTLIAAAFGFLGAKIFHILENFGSFLDDPGEMLFSFSGLTMYGGLILGSIAVLYYAHKQKFNILHVMDACAPGLFLAYGVGRLGCQVAGDGDWGIVNTAPKPGWLSWAPDWLWSYDYPNNVNGTIIPNDLDPKYQALAWLQPDGEHIKLLEPVFPTPLYESIMCIGLFFIFWALRKRFITPGFMFACFMIFNGIERFTIELIRVNTTLFTIGGFRVTQAEFIAFSLVTLGIALAVWTKKRKQSPPSPPKEETVTETASA